MRLNPRAQSERRADAVRTNRPKRRRNPVLQQPALLESRLLPSVTIQVRYDYDALGFFASPARRALMQSAADSLASKLGDFLSAITPTGQNSWSIDFPNPATGVEVVLPNPTIPANTMIVYVGAQPLAGTEAGSGGPGGYQAQGTPGWLNLIGGRGSAGAALNPPTDFAPWGGAITFDSGTNWYFGQDVNGLRGDQTDFLSVAEHEIGHVLGIGNVVPGQITAWSRLVNAYGAFAGSSATALYGGPVPLDPLRAHFADGVLFGGQSPAMVPVLLDGTRRLFGSLDFAALRDIGWQVAPSTSFQFFTSAASTTEGAGTIEVAVRRVGDLSTVATVQYAALNGSARAGIDFAPSSGTLVFAPNVSTMPIDVPIGNVDGAYNLARNFSIVLGTPIATGGTGASLGSPSLLNVTINDDDPPPPPVTISSVRIVKGAGNKLAAIVLTASAELNPSSARRARNYQLATSAGPDRVWGTSDDAYISLRPIGYDLANHTIRLAPRVRPTLKRPLRLTILGLVDELARAIDGDHDGQPGGAYVVTIRHSGVV